MKWIGARKGFLTYSAVIILTIMVLLSLSSCDVSAPKKIAVSALADTPTIANPSAVANVPPQPYPKPILVSPAPGAVIVGEKSTEFSWRWDGALREGEKFDLRIWRPERSSSTVAMLNVDRFLLDTPPSGFGQYQWQVIVVRIDKESGRSLTLSESQVWPFVWNDVTPTPVPTNTPTPTSTFTPTSTPTHTPTFTHTPTTTPTSTNTPIPTETQIPTPYYAPILTAPDNGVNVNGTFPPLDWHWDGELGENEYFEVRVWHENITTYHPALGWVKAPHFDYNITQELQGKYYWTVLVVEGQDARTKDWWRQEAFPYPVWDGKLVRELGPEGEVRFFFYVPPPDICKNCGRSPISEPPCLFPPCD